MSACPKVLRIYFHCLTFVYRILICLFPLHLFLSFSWTMRLVFASAGTWDQRKFAIRTTWSRLVSDHARFPYSFLMCFTSINAGTSMWDLNCCNVLSKYVYFCYDRKVSVFFYSRDRLFVVIEFTEHTIYDLYNLEYGWQAVHGRPLGWQPVNLELQEL